MTGKTAAPEFVGPLEDLQKLYVRFCQRKYFVVLLRQELSKDSPGKTNPFRRMFDNAARKDAASVLNETGGSVLADAWDSVLQLEISGLMKSPPDQQSSHLRSRIEEIRTDLQNRIFMINDSIDVWKGSKKKLSFTLHR